MHGWVAQEGRGRAVKLFIVLDFGEISDDGGDDILAAKLVRCTEQLNTWRSPEFIKKTV